MSVERHLEHLERLWCLAVLTSGIGVDGYSAVFSRVKELRDSPSPEELDLVFRGEPVAPEAAAPAPDETLVEEIAGWLHKNNNRAGPHHAWEECKGKILFTDVARRMIRDLRLVRATTETGVGGDERD